MDFAGLQANFEGLKIVWRCECSRLIAKRLGWEQKFACLFRWYLRHRNPGKQSIRSEGTLLLEVES